MLWNSPDGQAVHRSACSFIALSWRASVLGGCLAVNLWCVCVFGNSCASLTGAWRSSTTRPRSTMSGWHPGHTRDQSCWWTIRWDNRLSLTFTPLATTVFCSPLCNDLNYWVELSVAAVLSYRSALLHVIRCTSMVLHGCLLLLCSALLFLIRCTTTVWTCGALAACWPVWFSRKSPFSTDRTTMTRYFWSHCALCIMQ